MSLSKSWQFIGGLRSPWYRAYDGLRRTVNVRLVRFLLGHLKPSENADHADPGRHPLRVLEAGSGTAYASSLLAAHPQVSLSVCMDRDLTALTEARRRDPSLPAVVGDLMRMPFADGSFALVFNSSTLEHLDDPAAALGEMRRICQDDGRVFTGVPYARGPIGFQPLIRNTRVGVWLGKVFTRASLDRLLGAAGWTPVEHIRYFLSVFIGAVAVKKQPHG